MLWSLPFNVSNTQCKDTLNLELVDASKSISIIIISGKGTVDQNVIRILATKTLTVVLCILLTVGESM